MSHRLNLRTVSEHEWALQPGTAVDAAKARAARLRDASIKHQHLAGVTSAEITYTDPLSGDQITLTYTDQEIQ